MTFLLVSTERPFIFKIFNFKSVDVEPPMTAYLNLLILGSNFNIIHVATQGRVNTQAGT
jgi:hypothetical protein